jgi:quercetin dioxygenase-like cupin family protein
MQNTYEVPVGDAGIYSSPDVITPETKPGALDKPVFEDIRGVIKRLELDGIKVNLLSTKKGFMRSGDLHKHKQMDVLLSGKVELWTMQGGKTVKQVISPHTFIVIGANVPHLFNFLKDTVMLEWWEKPFEAFFYKPYRDIIDAQFKKMSETR